MSRYTTFTHILRKVRIAYNLELRKKLLASPLISMHSRYLNLNATYIGMHTYTNILAFLVTQMLHYIYSLCPIRDA
jgi:hypothetical protein